MAWREIANRQAAKLDNNLPNNRGFDGSVDMVPARAIISD